jgi:hypothetical protein
MLCIPLFYENAEYISLLRRFLRYLTTIYHMQTCGQNLKGGPFIDRVALCRVGEGIELS